MITRALVALAALLAAERIAAAYPQFQLTTGAKRCNQCHFAPAGTGLISGYGRDEAGETISMMGGNGAFLHGLLELPSWVALGGDVRGASLVKDVGENGGAYPAVFPMQFDLYQRFFWKGFSLQLIEGMVANVYETLGAVPLLSKFESREHWLMYQPKQQGFYVRAGRFFAPWGLRLVEHPWLVRRFSPFGYLFGETYNVSGGYIVNDWELHVTAFMPSFPRPNGDPGRGIAAYYERRFGDSLILGGQARYAVDEDGEGTDAGYIRGVDRATYGVIGKYWLAPARLLFQAQIDANYEMLDPNRLQLKSYLGASFFLRKGVMLTGVWERYDPDLSISGLSRNGFIAQAQVFPWAHFEVILFARTVLGGADPANMVMLQLHYYL